MSLRRLLSLLVSPMFMLVVAVLFFLMCVLGGMLALKLWPLDRVGGA